MEPKHFAQQITFLYAEDPAASWDFYENKLGLSLVQDQGTCRIYTTAPGDRAFLGVCRARAPRACRSTASCAMFKPCPAGKPSSCARAAAHENEAAPRS
jgi:predicted enzyme related to lactoylglutathione lyase